VALPRLCWFRDDTINAMLIKVLIWNMLIVVMMKG
jgi:hypothetical protein